MADHDCRSRAEPYEIVRGEGWLRVLCMFHCPDCGRDFPATLNGWSESAITSAISKGDAHVQHTGTGA